MSTDAGLDLFKAVRAAILADTYLAAQLGARVYSSWDNQDAATPLVRMSIPAARKFEMDGAGVGSETDLWVHVFTVESGSAVCRAIANKVRDVLDGQALALDGSSLISLDFRDVVPVRDDQSPKLQMLIVRFQAETVTA